MLESILAATGFEIGKELFYALLHRLRPSELVKATKKLPEKLANEYGRYGIISETRLLLFMQRNAVQRELQAFINDHILPDISIIETEFSNEFSTDFEPALLRSLSRSFARDFQDKLISSLPDEIGIVLKRIQESDQRNTAQHVQTHLSQTRMDTKLDRILTLSSKNPPPNTVVETEQLQTTQVQTQAGNEATLLTPFLRTIEYQERDLGRYRSALEMTLQGSLDEIVELIRGYELIPAKKRLEVLCNLELVNIPNPDEIDSSLRASIFRLLGVCQMRLADFKAAAGNFEFARSIDGNTEKLKKVMLEYFVMQHDFESATSLANELLAENPNLIEAKNYFALLKLENGRYDDVVCHYYGDTQADNDPTAQDILTIAYLQLGNIPAALELAQKLIILEPHVPRAFEVIGNVYLARAFASIRDQGLLPIELFREVVDRESLHQAISNFQKALDLYVNGGQEFLAATLRVNLANALSADRRSADALDIISENLEHQLPRQAEYFLLKSRFEDELGKPTQAMQTCHDALEYFPGDYRFMEIVGGLLLNNKQPDVAREWLKKAEQLCENPEDLTQLKILWAKTYLLEDDRDNAWKCLQEIPAAEKNNIELALAEGDFFYHFKNYSEAEKRYTLAQSMAPNHAALLDRVIKFYVSVDHPTKALPFAEKLVGAFPSTSTYKHYIELLIMSGRSRDALAVIVQAKEDGINSSYFVRQEAICRHDLGQIPEAIVLYEKHLAHEAADFVATFNLAICLQRRGERPKAIQTLEHATRLQPNNFQMHQTLAEMYKLEGDLENAFQHAQHALDLGPDDPNAHLFFFWIAIYCGHEEEAAKIIQEMPLRFPNYDRLTIVGIDEAKKLFASSREHYQQLESMYKEGSLPLALIAKWLHKPLPLTWQIFCEDDKLPILSALGSREEQQQSLKSAQESAKGGEAVVDYATLCTLYHLNLMDLPHKIFDRVYFAQETFDQIQEDINILIDLVPPRRLERLKTVSDIVYLNTKVVRQTDMLESSLILSPEQEKVIQPFHEQDVLLARQCAALCLLDNPTVYGSVEQVLPEQVTTTQRLLTYFYQSGKLRKTDLELAEDYLRNTNNLNNIGTSTISGFTTIVINHLSLEILVETNVFQLVIEEFDAIHISIPTLSLLSQNIGELKFYQQTLSVVKHIEASVKNHYTLFSPIVNEPDRYPDNKAFDSTFRQTLVLADQLQLSLWTDDLASRKLVASGEWGQFHTFNTRTILDLALEKKLVTPDEAWSAVLKLLKWNYQFTPINALIIFWSIQQRNFQFNDDSELLLSVLDQSVNHAHIGLYAVIQDVIANSHLANVEAQLELLFNNIKIYSDVLIRLWAHIPHSETLQRTRWTISILTRAAEALAMSRSEIDILVVLGISGMLQDLDRTKLSQLLMLLTSPLAITFLSEEQVDGAIIYIFARILFDEGNYDERKGQLAAKLMDSLRYAQYERVRRHLQQFAAKDPKFGNFFRTVQIERNRKRVVEAA